MTSEDVSIYAYHSKLTLETTLTFAAYTIGAIAFWGSFIFCFFLATGLVAVPFNQIIQWADRPKPLIDAGEFKKEKERVAKQIEWVLKSGKEIYEEKLDLDNKLENGNWLTSVKLFMQSRKSNVAQHEFEVNCMIIEKEFTKLQKVSQYNKKVEPCRYTCNLYLGLISFVLLIVFLTQMFIGGTLRFNGR